MLSPLDKKKTNSQLFSITEVIVSSELNGKIDTSNWLNQAYIMTPDFKKTTKLNKSPNNTSKNTGSYTNLSFSTDISKNHSPQYLEPEDKTKKNN